MSQAIQTSQLTPFPAAQIANAAPMLRLATIVRGLASDLLCASDTRIVKIASENAAGWGVEIEIFAPNPELTVSLRGGAKSILERSRYRLHFDLDMQLVALEPAEA